ncbi:MAG TPA: hypothetical protein H9783_00330 [Candidatus Limosilactobacillus faecipullorum]|nr:hypothetical protein [Candidatus Limosilactobacillus faecipullorum]
MHLAWAATFLASDAADYITGQLLPVASGFRMSIPIYGDTLGQDNHR